jgi:TonB family protein
MRSRLMMGFSLALMTSLLLTECGRNTQPRATEVRKEASPGTEPSLNTEPLRLGPGITPPTLIKKGPQPNPLHVISPREGLVVAEATVGRDGKVTDVKIVRSLGPAFDMPVIEYVKGCEYTPARKDGTPVAVILPVTVRFQPSR